MFLVFILTALGIVAFSIWQFGAFNDASKNLAPANAYAQNLAVWHQAAMLVAADVDSLPANIITLPSCKMVAPIGWNSFPSWDDTKICTLTIPVNLLASPPPGNNITSKAAAINASYLRMEDWRSFYYKVSNNEAYVITLYSDLDAGNAGRDHGVLKPDYIVKGLREDMGFDRTGVGLIKPGCINPPTAPPSATSCLAQFEPLAYQKNQTNNAVSDSSFYIFDNSNQSSAALRAAIGQNSVGIITRVR